MDVWFLRRYSGVSIHVPADADRGLRSRQNHLNRSPHGLAKMAKLIGPLHSEQATGKLGGLVYQQRGSQSRVCAHSPKISKHSPLKQIKFSKIHMLQAKWHQMSHLRRICWREAQQNKWQLWWNNSEFTQTGYALFLSVGYSCLRALREPTDYPWTEPIDIRLVEIRASLEPELLNVWAEFDGSFPLDRTFLFLNISRFHSPGRKPDWYSSREYSQELCDVTVGIDTENHSGAIDIWGRLFCDLGYRSNLLQRTFEI